MRGLNHLTSMRGRTVSLGAAALLALCLTGAPIPAYAQNDVAAEPSFSAQSGKAVDQAFDLAADDDVQGAIRVLEALALNPNLTAFERSSVSQMIGAYHYELGQLFEAKVAFDAALDAGGLSQKDIDGMKPILANIDALDKLGLLKPKVVQPAAEPEVAAEKPVIVKAEPVPDTDDSALLMASVKTDATASADMPDDSEPAMAELVDADTKKPEPIIKEASLKKMVDDRDAQPLVRVPPIMPRRFLEGNHSGFCDVRFDVSPEGRPIDVDATRCTDSSLKRATVKSVEKWKFSPKIVNGRAVSRSGVESKVSYILTDERGRKLPLPSGY